MDSAPPSSVLSRLHGRLGEQLCGACRRASSVQVLAEITVLRAPLLRLTCMLQKDNRWKFWFAATAEK